MMNISVSIGLNGTPHGNAKQLWPAKSLHGQSLQSAQIIVDQTEAPVFSTVSRVVMWAKDAFSQTLVFLPSAIKGAANSPFRNTGKLVQLFKALHQVATDMRMDGGRVADGMHSALAKKGFTYKPWISQTAAGKFVDDYAFMYRGRRVLFGEHVTLGAGPANTCMSVHFLIEAETHRIVIGWCGRHGTNTRT